MSKRTPYSHKELFGGTGVRRFAGRQLDQIAFPLGGIGSGCVSLGGWGQLRDWEIFNHPAKGLDSGTSFFAVRCREAGRRPVVRLLQGPPGGSYVGGGHGLRAWNAKFPAFRNCRFEGDFPFARVRLQDDTVPLSVELEAFNPFIPLDDRNSSLPVAIFRFRLRNRTRRRVRVQVLALLENLLGHPEPGRCRNTVEHLPEGGGIRLETQRHEPDSPRFGTLALLAPRGHCTGTARAISEAGFDGAWEFWQALEQRGEFPLVEATAQSALDQTLTAGLRIDLALAGGEETEVPFVLAWHSPVSDAGGKPWKTYVGSLFPDAWSAARYAADHLDSLTRRSRRFRDLLQGSTLPGPALEALSSQLSILKSPTCLRFEDGRFWGWEGCSDTGGCCAGTCSHVWNYAQAMAWLFPQLERSVREQHFALNMDPETGRMCFRQPLPPGTACNIAGFHAAADGQLGGVMKVYREWMISGDDYWLRRVWPQCVKSLEFAWQFWDYDRDGVVEGVMHNTYDNEFWGPNSMIQTFYLGALRAAAEMAEYLQEGNLSRKYAELFAKGRAWTEKHLFNGRWYHQIIDAAAGEHTPFPSTHLRDGEALPRYQYGEGCLSDQLIGEWYAAMLGLGPLLDPGRVHTALKSVFKYNWKPELGDHACLLRAYAVDGEGGLLLCTWPRKVTPPPYPFWFSSEVWCGIEYQVAAHMIHVGLQEEAMAIVKSVRDRHSGERRNPYDEFECGHHYSRSLASWALLQAFSGFRYHGARGELQFAPRYSAERFACFFSVGSGWGSFHQKRKRSATRLRIELEEGDLRLFRLRLPGEKPGRNVRVRVGKKTVPVRTVEAGDGMVLVFAPECRMEAGQVLSVVLTPGA